MRALRTTIALAVASAVVGVPVAQSAAAAGETNTPVVTRAEYRKIQKGTELTRVHKVFGTAGKKTNSNPGDPLADPPQPATQSREYRTGSKYGFVTVYFEQADGAWVVTRKAVYWG